MREAWAEDFAAVARAYWTDERTQQVISGKTMCVLPGEAPILLRSMGILHRGGKMPPKQVRKYRQINHMVAILGPPLRELRDRFEVVRLVDAGCGRSYLTMLLAYHFKHNLKHPVEVLGIDRNPEVIDASRERAAIAGLDDVLRFEAAAIDEVELADVWERAFGHREAIHGLVALHACDTATDDALVMALEAAVEMIAVAPCCQAELSACWSGLADEGRAGAFSPIWTTPHLRRATAATVTDTFRTLLIRGAGYWVTTLEFVASAHTPKNTLIRGIKRGERDDDALREYLALRQATGGLGIALERRLPVPLRQALDALGARGG